MPMGIVCAGKTSGAVVVEVRPLSISASVYEGPSVMGVVIVEDNGGSDGGPVANIFGIWTGGCGARRRATEFSLAFIRLASNIL